MSLAVSRTHLALIAMSLGAAAAAAGCDSCGDDDKAPRAGTGPAAPAATTRTTVPGAQPLTATLDGAPLVLRSALLRSFGGQARSLTVSTASMSCAELGQWRERASEKTVSLMLAPRLLPNGEQHWAITSATYEHTTRRGSLGVVSLSGDKIDGPVDVSLSLNLVTPVSQPSGGSVNRRLVLEGKLRAEGCGERGSNPSVEIREQQDMQWKVAGHTFVARGATVTYKPGGAVLRLSSEPHSCTTSLSGSDLTATLYIDGPPPVARRLVLGGNLLGREHSAKLDPNVFTARLDASPSGKRFAHVTVQGGTKAGGYPVVMEGVADAAVCAPGK